MMMFGEPERLCTSYEARRKWPRLHVSSRREQKFGWAERKNSWSKAPSLHSWSFFRSAVRGMQEADYDGRSYVWPQTKVWWLCPCIRNPKSQGDRRKKPWCDHYKKPWHTRETCWKIHGKPPHLKKRTDGRALQTVADSSQEHHVKSSTPSFTKEQLEQLYNLFQSS